MAGVRSMVALALGTVAFLGRSRLALAWDKDGHEAVGMTCMSALQKEATAQVKHLMHGRDASDVAGWGHKVNKKFPWTNQLHFQQQPSLLCKGADFSVCPGNRCLVSAMKYFYGKLTDAKVDEIDWGKGITLTDADHVKYLINLIGDLHMPMHFTLDPKVDARNMTATYNGKKMSLYDIWNAELAQAVIRESPGFWLGGWTKVTRVQGDFERDTKLWQQNGVKEFERWADQTVNYLCHSIYRSNFDDSDALPAMQAGTFVLSEETWNAWKQEMLKKILVAGYRVAIVLNAVLQHREGKHEMHAGTAMRDVDETEEDLERPPHIADILPRGSGSSRALTGVHAFLANLVIFSGVSVAFLQVMRYWRGKDAISQADRAKNSASGKGI